MIRLRRVPTHSSLVVVLGFLLCLVVPPPLVSAEVPPPARAVQQAWRNAHAAGGYHFATQIAQITYPAPALVNVGRSSRRDELYLTGEAHLPPELTPVSWASASGSQRSLHMTLWQHGGSILNPADGIEIRIEGDQAHGRQGQGPWQEIDDFSGAFAPGQDLMGYLAGATNIREVPRERFGDTGGRDEDPDHALRVTHYVFDVDGPDFADYLRDQLEAYYRQRGELPMGLSLESPREFQAVTGEGTLSIDDRGLPRRLTVHLVYPPRRDGQRIEAHITTDFSRFVSPELATSIAFAEHPGAWLTTTLRLPQNRASWGWLGQRALLAAASLGLLASVVFYRRSRYVYTVVALAMIVAMVLGPVLQGHHVHAFSQGLAEKRAEQEKRDDEMEVARQQRESFLTTDWDPHQDPLEETAGRVSIPDRQPATGTSHAPSPASRHLLVAADDDDETFDPAGDDDGDGLSNLAEKRLGTDPNNDDTDGDGITDDAEVRGFQALDGTMYYLDPLSPDTNGDGLTDGMECPQLVRTGTDVLSPVGVCQNTDADLEDAADLPRVPDAFDTDNDNDGVPDKVDLSPFSAVGSVQSTFGRNKPLALTLEDLQAGEPVLLDLQVRPQDPDHLAYALNVLDWPTGDNDGQIQRVLDNTFGTHLTTEQLGRDPSAQNGEVRLVPMVEMRLTGRQVPFKLTRPRTTVEVRGDISATVRMEQPAGKPDETALNWTLEDDGAYYVGVFEGPCPTSPSTDPTKYDCGTFGGNDACTIDGRMTELADGGHHLMFTESEDVWACQTIGNVVNGPYDDRMIDPDPMGIYGVSVREMDDDGNLLAYAPVSVVQDELGARNVAFAARIPFEVGGGLEAGEWGNAPQLRLVWLVQMLTDVCDMAGLDEDATDDEVQAWCDQAAHRVEQTQFVHTYDEDWYVSGLSVREDHGLDVALVYEDPASDAHPENDDYLWLFAKGLEGGFVSGRLGDDGERDLTIPKIKQTFDVTSTAPISPTRWNIPLNALRVESYGSGEFPQQAHLAKISEYAEDILTSEFLDGGAPTAEAPTLLIAREEHYRSVSLEAGTASVVGGSVAISFDGAQVETVAAFQWRPYRHRNGAWEAYPIQEYMDLLSVRLGDAFREHPELYDPDYRGTEYAELALDTEILAWQSRYLSFHEGLSNVVQVGPEGYELPDGMVSNGKLAAMAESWTLKGFGFGELAVQLALVNDILDHLAKTLAERADEAERIIPSWLFEEAGDVGAELNQGMMASLKGKLSNLKLRDVWGAVSKGVDLTLAAAAVLCMAMSMSGSRGWQIAGYVLGVVSAAWSLGQAIYTLAVRGTEEAAKSTIKIFGSAMSTAKVAGVIGIIVGAVVAFGFFIYAVAAAGAEFFGLAFNALLAQTIAQVIVAVIMFAIAQIPIVGQLIAAIIAVIDALIYLICGLIGEDAQEHVVGQWLCKGISGIATEIIKLFIYDAHDLVNMQLENRLQTFNFDWAFASGSERKGTSVGSELDVTLGVTSTIQLNHVFPTWEEMLEGWKEGTKLIPIDWKSLSYAWQFNNDKLREATFEYKLQTADSDFHEQVSRDTMWSAWQPGEDDIGKFEIAPFYVVRDVDSGSDPVTLNYAGINQPMDLYLSEGYNLPIQECIALPIGPLCGTCPLCPFVCWVPECHIRDNDGSNHIDMGQRFIMDVFPATLDGFYEAVEKDGGYSLAWGQSTAVTTTLTGADALVFPRQLDFDGDGELNQADGGSDPDDSRWDTDGDLLSDLFELQTGSDPTNPDADGDGLTDDAEARLGTNPYREDTDGDGLTDAEETRGWEFVYELDPDGNQLKTWVTSDPLSPDGDNDGWTDFQEKTYGLHPRVPSVATLLSLDSRVDEARAPKLLLRFEDEPETAVFADSSGYNHAGACTGDACPIVTDGRYVRGIQLDGTDDAVRTELMLDQGAAGPGATLMAWVYPESSEAGNQQIVSTNDGNGDWSLTQSGSSWRVFLGNGAQRDAGTVSLDQWQHVAVVFDPGAGTRLFKNGDQVGVWDDVYHNPQTGSVTIGATPGGGACFEGRIDEVAVFDRPMTEAEIGAAMAGLYNPQDLIVSPGDTLAYQATVKNELLGRQAEGLLKTEFPGDGGDPSSFTNNTIDPTTFVLLPQESETMAGTVDVAGAASSGTMSMTQVAGAIIADWREQCGFAELWLPLNESGTNFTDHCGGIPARGAQCSGTRCPAREASGYFDYGLSFDGDNDYLTLLQGGEPLSANDVGLTPGEQRQGSFSVSVWAKGSGGDFDTGDRAVLGTDEQTTHQGLMLGVRDGKAHMAFYNNGLNSNYRLRTDRWYHLVFRYNAADREMAIFVNGEPRAVDAGHAPFQGEGTLHVGRAQGGSPFQGTLDDLRIFGRALTTAEIRMLYGQPVLEMHFDDPAPYKDDSGFGNTTSGVHCPTWQPPGITGKALGFNSDQSHHCELQGTTLPNMDLKGSAFTWAMWLYPSGSSTFPQGIVGKYVGFGDTDGANTGLAKNSYPSLLRVGRKLRFGFSADTDGDGDSDEWRPVETGNVLTQDTWNHVVVSFGPVYDENDQFVQNKVTFFVNGDPVKSQGVSDPVSYDDATNETIRVGRVSHKGQVYLDRLYVVDEGDGAGKAEVYIEWDDSRVCGGTNDDKGGGCRHDDLVDEDEREIDETLNVYESGRLEVWEQDSSNVAVDGGPDCILDDELINHTFSTNDPGADTWFYGSGGGCGAYGSTDVRLFYTYSNPSVPFYGRLDDLYLYKRALSLEEVQELYLSTFALLRLPLDEAPGSDNFENVVDLSGQSNGFCSGDGCPTSGMSGRENQAALFDGVDDRVRTELSIDQGSGGGGATLMAWVRPRSSSGGDHHIVSTDDGNRDWSLLRTGDTWAVFAGDGAHLTAGYVEEDQWQHVAAIFDPSGVTKLFKNGALIETWTQVGHNPVNGHVTVGALPGGGAHFDGRIDDVRVFDHAIRDEDVQLIYASAPILQLHLDEPAGATAFQDSSGNRNDGACTGTSCPHTGLKGRVGLSPRFDGVNDGIRVFDDWLLDLSSFSVGAWVMPGEILNRQQELIGKSQNYGLLLAAGGLTPTLKTGNQTVHSDVELSLDTWSHVIGTYDDETKELEIYVNGYLQGRETLGGSFTPPHNSTALRLGGIEARFAGQLDEVTLYSRALSPFEVRDIFLYQGKWVEDRESTAVTVDDAPPESDLSSYNAAFPYRANRDVVMHLAAQDDTSGVAMAEVCTCYGNVAGCCAYASNWAAAPPCQDGGDTAWCPTFDPTKLSGEGTYTLQTRTTDRVGHRESPEETYTLYVDGTPPDIETDIQDGALLAAQPHPTQPRAWTVSLAGRISDPELTSGVAGSGLDPDTFTIVLVTPEGTLAGAKRGPVVDGENWTIDYGFLGAPPTGRHTVRAEAADRMGNTVTIDLAEVQVDATASSAALDPRDLPSAIADTLDLDGGASELPGLAQTELVLHVEEEDGATVFRDSSGWGRDGTCTGGACPDVIAGMYGRALQFDGVQQVLTIEDFEPGNERRG